MAISWTDNDITATINMPSPLGTVYATGSSVTFTIPKVQAKATGSYMEPPFYLGLGQNYSPGNGWSDSGSGLVLKYGSTSIKELRGHSAKVAKNTYVDIAYSTSASVTLTTSSYFKSTNPSTRSVTLSLVAPRYCHLDAYEPSVGGSSSCANPSEKTLNNITLTLNVPPTATVSAISYDTPYVYAGLTTASVTVSNVSAKYGGNVTDVTLTIGNQSDSISGNGTLSIALDTAGTFTPTVTVTDSRGQTKSYSLDPITVNAYTAPSVSFDVDRTNSSGQLDDEGTYCLITATLTFTDVIASALAPSVVATDETGTQTTPTVNWYTDNTLTTAVTWANVSSGDTVYGIFSGVNTQYSYQVSVRPRDTEGTGEAIVQTLPGAFYTVDFLAGGHGIAFGMPASQDGFFCNMPANFVDANDVMRALFDFVYPVGSYYETSDTLFDPNVTWGGTWVKDSAGRVTVAQDTGDTWFDTVGETGGSKHIQAHTHSFTNPTITSYFRSTVAYSSGSAARPYTSSGSSSTTDWSRASGGAVGGVTGLPSGQSTDSQGNLQPYIVVVRWHRTA